MNQPIRISIGFYGHFDFNIIHILATMKNYPNDFYRVVKMYVSVFRRKR